MPIANTGAEHMLLKAWDRVRQGAGGTRPDRHMFLCGIYSGMEVKEKNVVAVIQINKGSKNEEGSEAPESTGYKNTISPAS